MPNIIHNSDKGTPMFVRLFTCPDQMPDRQVLINNWNTPPAKQFHVVDSPQVSLKISEFDASGQGCLKKSRKTFKENRKSHGSQLRSTHRIKYKKLQNQIQLLNGHLNSECLTSQLKESEMLQYRQKLLVSYMKDFVDHLSTECHQKADFLKETWNSLIFTFEHILETTEKATKHNQKSALSESLSLHQKYQGMIEKVTREKEEIKAANENHKELIRSLVRTLREKRKEMKIVQGGLNQYNSQMNEISNQFSELQREHLDILMYGHTGNMTKDEAENLLIDVLKPEGKSLEKVSYKVPKLEKGKSNKYLQKPDQREEELISSRLEEEHEAKSILECLDSEQLKLKNNFVPRKVKSKDVPRVNIKVQTEQGQINEESENVSIQCGYFSRMEHHLIKNRSSQTEILRKVTCNGSYQTDLTGSHLDHKSKRLKLESKVSSFQREFQHKLKESNALLTDGIEKTPEERFKEYAGDQLSNSESSGDGEKSAFVHKNVFKSMNSSGANFSNHKIKKLKNSRDFESGRNIESKKSVRKQTVPGRTESRKTTGVYKPIKTEGSQRIMTQNSVKTQSFIQNNKMRVSRSKNEIVRNVSAIKNDKEKKLQQISRPSIQLCQIVSLLDVGLSGSQQQQTEGEAAKQPIPYMEHIFRILEQCKYNQASTHIDISYFYNNKFYKNRNISILNANYQSALKKHSAAAADNPKKNDKHYVSSVGDTFTLKKSLKTIEQVLEVALTLKKSRTVYQINVVQILEEILEPKNSYQKTFEAEKYDEPRQTRPKTLEFLKYLTRHSSDSYFVKNFFIISGITFSAEANPKQANVVNINKNFSKKGSKSVKHLHITTFKTNSLHDKPPGQSDQLIYSSEVQFYLDMVLTLNCNPNKQDLQNAYTTVSVFKNCLSTFQSFYPGNELSKKIQEVISQSLNSTVSEDAKLNMYKCLYIFFDKIMERKRELILSYENFFQHFAVSPPKTSQAIFRSDDSLSQKMIENSDLLQSAGKVNGLIAVKNILSLLDIQKSTQLKVLSKCNRFYPKFLRKEDLVTLLMTEGIPELKLLESALIATLKSPELLKILLSKKSKIQVLSQDSQFSSQQLVSYFRRAESQSALKIKNQEPSRADKLEACLTFKKAAEMQVQKLIGTDLSYLDLALTFVDKEKWHSL